MTTSLFRRALLATASAAVLGSVWAPAAMAQAKIPMRI